MIVHEVSVKYYNFFGATEVMFYFTTEEEAQRFIPIAKITYDTTYVYYNPVRVYGSIEEINDTKL
jgi:hypothetical protein